MLSCPHCGAPQDIVLGTKQLVCPYCQTTLFLRHDVLHTDGIKAGVVPFPTVFSVGKKFYAVSDSTSNDMIAHHSVRYISEQEWSSFGWSIVLSFYVYGHIRVYNDAGFRDRRFVRVFNDTDHLSNVTDLHNDLFLEEDEWLISLYVIDSITSAWDRAGDKGNKNTITNKHKTWLVGKTYQWKMIQETGQAHIEWWEWQLWFTFDPWLPLHYTRLEDANGIRIIDTYGNVQLVADSL